MNVLFWIYCGYYDILYFNSKLTIVLFLNWKLNWKWIHMMGPDSVGFCAFYILTLSVNTTPSFQIWYLASMEFNLETGEEEQTGGSWQMMPTEWRLQSRYGNYVQAGQNNVIVFWNNFVFNDIEETSELQSIILIFSEINILFYVSCLPCLIVWIVMDVSTLHCETTLPLGIKKVTWT